MFELINFSPTGNKKKVSGTISRELRVTAKDVKAAGILPEDPYIFLSSGCYGLGQYCSLLKKAEY
jgi:hypothetical protein